MSKFVTLWFWRGRRLTADWFHVESYTTDEHPHPMLVTTTTKPTFADPFTTSQVDKLGRLVVGLDHGHLPDAPPLWHVLIREYNRPKPSQSLVSFATNDFPDGTVVEASEYQTLDLPSFSERVAAIRWGFGDPKIEQLYVADNWRRRRISVKVINCADLVNMAGNWGGFIYGGDQTTDMGAELADAWTNSNRLRERIVRLPPMN
jgi:hypothetical protein